MMAESIRALTANFEGYELGDHFADIGKKVALGCGSRREIDDISSRLEQKTTGFFERIIGLMIAFNRTYVDPIDFLPLAVAKWSDGAKVPQPAAQLDKREIVQPAVAQSSGVLSRSRSTTEPA